MMQVLTFGHGKEYYCIPIQDVAEVVQDVTVVSLPRLPKQFEGIFQLRGKMIALLNFSRCLGTVEDKLLSEILVFSEPADHLGLRVTGTVESLILQGEQINVPSQETAVSEFLEGIFYDGKEVYHLLSLPKILNYAGKLIRIRTGEQEGNRVEL